MIRLTTPVSRKRFTYQTERVGTTKLRRVIMWSVTYSHPDVARVSLALSVYNATDSLINAVSIMRIFA